VASIKSLAENKKMLSNNYLKLGPKSKPADVKMKPDVIKVGAKKIEFSSSLVVPGHDSDAMFKLNEAIQSKKKQYSGSIVGSSPKFDKLL